MPSTIYLFGQYFAWVRMLEESLRQETFQAQQAKDDLFDCIDEVGKCLRRFPAGQRGKDRQVFQLQQRAIGELLILHEADSRRCMSYPEFVEKWRGDDQGFKLHLKPLEYLLRDLHPGDHTANGEPWEDDPRWARLSCTENKLDKLRCYCEKLLGLREPSRRISELCAKEETLVPQ
jgi:hypothetical protein